MLLRSDEGGDFVKLLDFGIAKLLARPGQLLQRFTQTGQTFGSPVQRSTIFKRSRWWRTVRSRTRMC
jgi:hypothetical protein